ncbi:hypothetical protein [Kutzneria sp. NPDC051319]|uniref:hypothetical protein n=1 Tax=Kutzneria sp. NPDC051319 TaxID=3155047 RepID=UPI00342859DE
MTAAAGMSDPDVRRELVRVAETVEHALAHHRARDQAAATLSLGAAKPAPLTLRLEFAAKGLRALLAHEYPDPNDKAPQGEQP